MRKLESVPKNLTHKILWDFEIQTDQPILAKRPDLEENNLVDFTFPRTTVKLKESEMKDKESWKSNGTWK